ncbi:MAG: ATP-binding protein [Chlorobi bacterium]|nr:ATP-binding protein [Chlorobiota bacterium]
MENLRKKYLRLLNSIDLSPKRFLFDNITWDDQLIILKGQRGTGKTTLILQHIKSHFSDLSQTLYISLDDIHFSKNTISEVVDEFVKDDGKYLFLDEVHRYKNWSREIKNIYDFYPDLQLVITGSSAIDFYINSSDLGRRASVYTLPELSFREYLNFVHNKKFIPYSLDDIIQKPEQISISINSEIKSIKLFHQYLMNGAYPFILHNENKFYEKLEAIINTVIDNDIPAVDNIQYESQIKLKKLLLMLASTFPFKVNISELSRKLGTTRDVLIKFLHLLNKGGIITLLSTEGIGHAIIQKPEKIYLSNTNIIYAISNDINIGNIRETFFLNQVSSLYNIKYPKAGDFFVDGKYTFEIGGRNKTKKQVAHLENSFLALDDIEYGYKAKIPLWLFGFLY